MMRGMVAATLAMGLLVACADIDTADEASGEIESMDGSSITLDSGGTFVVPPGQEHLLNDLDTDQGVTVFYKEENGQKVVQEIFPVE
jgi:hypothetical protein